MISRAFENGAAKLCTRNESIDMIENVKKNDFSQQH